MHKIEITPAPCMVCGTGNTPNGDGSRREFVDLERDVNWNDPAIICGDCLMNASSLIGMASPDTLQTLRRELREKDRELHATKAQMDTMKKRAKKLGVEFVKPESAVA
jgi:hypothetical protein